MADTKISDEAVHDALVEWIANRGTAQEDMRAAIAAALPTSTRSPQSWPSSRGDARTQFEAWNRENFGAIDLSSHSNGEYRNARTRNDWDLWQAALAATGKQQVGEVQGAVSTEAVRQFVADRAPNDEHREDVLSGDYDHTVWFDHIRELMTALAARQPVAQEPVELACVAETLAHGEGLWMTCSGCHESNEGVPTGPYSQIMQCHLGNGCDECGGIGATWDTTDYQQMADGMSKSLAAPPAHGIDLGQFRPAVELLVQKAKDGVTACRMYWGPTNPDATEKAAQKLAEAERLLALIDQRDAAPGVGS